MVFISGFCQVLPSFTEFLGLTLVIPDLNRVVSY